MGVHIIAYPVGGAWVVECSGHGLVGVIADPDVDLFLACHMSDHGVMAVA